MEKKDNNGQLTVKELLELCQEQMEMGNADKVIVVSDDNEGNGYHGLFYGFTEDPSPFEGDIYDSAEKDIDKLIILG